MCICGISIILQMAVINCYHVHPLREIPGWLKNMQACMSHISACLSKSHNSDVHPYHGESGKFDKHDTNTGHQTDDAAHAEARDAGKAHPIPGVNAVSGIDLIAKKIRADEDEEDLRLQWRKLARSFDRLLFVIFAIFHLCMALLLFVIMPNT